MSLRIRDSGSEASISEASGPVGQIQSDSCSIEELKGKNRLLKERLKDSQKTCGQFSKALRNERINHRKTWNAAADFDKRLSTSEVELDAVKQQLNDLPRLSKVQEEDEEHNIGSLQRDVVKKLMSLNTTIIHAGTIFANTISYHQPRPTVELDPKTISAFTKAKPMLGSYMALLFAMTVHHLASPGFHSGSAKFIQLLMQIVLVRWCRFKIDGIRSSDTFPQSGFEDFWTLFDINDADKRANIMLFLGDLPDESPPNRLMVGMINVMELLELCGWSSKDLGEAELMQTLSPILKETQQLSDILRKENPFTVFMVSGFPQGAVYQPSRMGETAVDVTPSNTKPKPLVASPEYVAGTAIIGLLRVVVKRIADVPEMVREDLCLPKAVLASTIKNIAFEAIREDPKESPANLPPDFQDGRDS